MITLEDLACRLEALWPLEEWGEWVERIPSGPSRKRLAFALFALLCCAHYIDEEGDLVESFSLDLWRNIERLALHWAGMTESEFIRYFMEAEALFQEAFNERFASVIFWCDRGE